LRDHFLAFVLGFFFSWSEAQPLGRLFFGKVVLYSLEGLQLGFGLCFLHDLVSVFHQNFLNEWLLI
jgi:hypothetical protein